MYTQIVAAVWAFLAWGQAYEFVVSGNGFLRAAVFLALSWLSHLIVGYGVSAITVVLVLAAVLKDGRQAWRHAMLRWLALNVTVAFLISYLILPTLVEAHVLNRSRFEPPEYWDSYGAETCLKWLFKGALLDRVYSDGPWSAWIGNVPVFTTIVLTGVVLICLNVVRDVVFTGKRRVLEPGTRQALVLLIAFVAAFILFTGRSTFGSKLLRLVPFSHSLPFHRFFVHFHMFSILIAGWLLHQACCFVCFVASKRSAWIGPVLCGVLVVGLIVYPVSSHLYGRTMVHQRDLNDQNLDVEQWWGNATFTLMQRVADVVHHRPGRAYAGGGWNWGKQFTLKFARVYSLWQQRGLWVPNISYMWHAMGLNSEMDNHLVETRLDHLKLFNLR